MGKGCLKQVSRFYWSRSMVGEPTLFSSMQVSKSLFMISSLQFLSPFESTKLPGLLKKESLGARKAHLSGGWGNGQNEVTSLGDGTITNCAEGHTPNMFTQRLSIKSVNSSSQGFFKFPSFTKLFSTLRKGPIKMTQFTSVLYLFFNFASSKRSSCTPSCYSESFLEKGAFSKRILQAESGRWIRSGREGMGSERSMMRLSLYMLFSQVVSTQQIIPTQRIFLRICIFSRPVSSSTIITSLLNSYRLTHLTTMTCFSNFSTTRFGAYILLLYSHSRIA